MSVAAESHMNATPAPSAPSAFRVPDPTRARGRTLDPTPGYPPTVAHTPSRTSVSTLGPRRDPFATRARCYDPQWTNTRLFFSERPQDIAKAKMMCAGCELRDDCLAGATERGEPVGVWGGECFHNGHIVAMRRGRGRPRKERTAAVSVVSAPIPERLHARRVPTDAR
jgi:WhiB family redox-sensing transcriptional regulator